MFRWNGSSWSALGSEVNGPVYAVAVSGNDLYAGGDFTAAGVSDAYGIAKWDGSSWSALASGLVDGNGFPYVNALAVSGSDLYAGGSFVVAGDVTGNNIAKWNGSTWSALGSGMGGPNADVRALAVSGSDVYVGGNFTTAGGSAANRIAKWDGSRWSALGSGMGGAGALSVSALAVSGTNLYAGGNFTMAGGKVSGYIARAYLPTIPTLSVLRSRANVMVSWPSADTASFALEQAGVLLPTATWATNTASIADDGTNKSVTLPATNSSQFFRLRRP